MLDNIINKIIQADCFDILRDMPDESVDMILTDPPYNISQKEYKIDRQNLRSEAFRRKTALNYDFGLWDRLSGDDYFVFLTKLLTELSRVLKEGGAFVIFLPQEYISLPHLMNLDVKLRTLFTWHKTNPMPNLKKTNYTSSNEYIWIGSKGKWNFNLTQQSELHNFYQSPNKSIYGKTKHPTEKPLELIRRFVFAHTNIGDTILDACSGSGTTAIACFELNRNFICIEKEPEYWAMSNERLKTHTKQLKNIRLNTGE